MQAATLSPVAPVARGEIRLLGNCYSYERYPSGALYSLIRLDGGKKERGARYRVIPSPTERGVWWVAAGGNLSFLNLVVSAETGALAVSR